MPSRNQSGPSKEMMHPFLYHPKKRTYPWMSTRTKRSRLKTQTRVWTTMARLNRTRIRVRVQPHLQSRPTRPLPQKSRTCWHLLQSSLLMHLTLRQTTARGIRHQTQPTLTAWHLAQGPIPSHLPSVICQAQHRALRARRCFSHHQYRLWRIRTKMPFRLVKISTAV